MTIVGPLYHGTKNTQTLQALRRVGANKHGEIFKIGGAARKSAGAGGRLLLNALMGKVMGVFCKGAALVKK